LHCLEETGSELKLIVFQEKSSILAHRPALWVEGADLATTHIPAR
jgi:hypothetical protein